MARKYFGTDGIRGRVGEAPMTVDFALRLASAAARVLAPEGGRVVIGKDTRLSGYMFESALEAGFVAAGVDVLLTGPMPTPGIAYLATRMPGSFGVVISASHNPYEDNGIKFFDSSGEKLSDELEERIELEMERGVHDAGLQPPRSGAPRRQRAGPVPGVLRFHRAGWPRSVRHEAGDRQRQWCRLQGRSAVAGGAGCRCHSDRQFAQWPQHQ